jgi:DNA-binding PadR family transcriptional regulator
MSHTHPPLKPLTIDILIALGERTHHGYSLMRALREDSRFGTPVHTGPLYRTLKHLLDGGLVAERAAPPEGMEDDARRGSYYTLSDRGREVLADELARLDALVRYGARLGLAREGSR